ncbi:hypothetical protein JTB14_010164 [Gonioctena quinquepunctata]|nr:hypothetical protein JTB14_010164 [Gonioctena quinquepunctata]
MFSKIIYVTLFFYLAPNGTTPIQINYIKVPVAVKNDSKSAVVMDCNYSLRPDDADLVVKWYLNDDLVYQWIPPQSPQSFGALKNKVDLAYRATHDTKTVYRAMKIINPVAGMAGEYKCFVSTFTDEDFAVKTMKIFVPERSLDIFQGTSDENIVNFTCLASDVFPTPKLLMYRSYEEEHYRNRLQTVERDISKHQSGRYSLFIVASALRETLIPGSIIRCELRIPGTGYVKIKSLLYYPEGDIPTICESTTIAYVTALWIFSSAVFSNKYS